MSVPDYITRLIRRQRLQQIAHIAVLRGVASGEIVRPRKCEKCAAVVGPRRDGRRAIQAHHENYRKPLAVWWLCRSCHAKRHVHLRRREAARAA